MSNIQVFGREQKQNEKLFWYSRQNENVINKLNRGLLGELLKKLIVESGKLMNWQSRGDLDKGRESLVDYLKKVLLWVILLTGVNNKLWKIY